MAEARVRPLQRMSMMLTQTNDMDASRKAASWPAERPKPRWPRAFNVKCETNKHDAFCALDFEVWALQQNLMKQSRLPTMFVRGKPKAALECENLPKRCLLAQPPQITEISILWSNCSTTFCMYDILYQIIVFSINQTFFLMTKLINSQTKVITSSTCRQNIVNCKDLRNT